MGSLEGVLSNFCARPLGTPAMRYFTRHVLRVFSPSPNRGTLSRVSVPGMSEIDKFCPSLRTVRFHGSKEERSRIKEVSRNEG